MALAQVFVRFNYKNCFLPRLVDIIKDEKDGLRFLQEGVHGCPPLSHTQVQYAHCCGVGACKGGSGLLKDYFIDYTEASALELSSSLSPSSVSVSSSVPWGSFIEHREAADCTYFNELAVERLHAFEVAFLLVKIGRMTNLTKIEDHYIEGPSVMQQLLDAYGQGTQMVSSVAPPVPASPALPMPSDSASGQYLG